MLGEQGMDQGGRIVKICGPQRRERSIELDQSLTCRIDQHADRARDTQALSAGGRGSCTVIDQEQPGAERVSQRDRGALAGIKPTQRGRLGGGVVHRKPRRRAVSPRAYRSRSVSVTQLAGDDGGHSNGAEQLWQHVNLADQNEVMKRPGVRDDDARGHGSGATKCLQVYEVAPDVLQGDRFVYAALLEEAVEFEPCLEAEDLPQLEMGEASDAVGFCRERLKRLAREIRAGAAQAFGEVIRNGQDEVHPARLADRAGKSKGKHTINVYLCRARHKHVSRTYPYQMWLDTLPPGLTESTTADLLDAVCAIDLSELKTIELPRGFGRDG